MRLITFYQNFFSGQGVSFPVSLKEPSSLLLRYSLPAFSSPSRGFFLAGSSKPHLRSSEYSITRILDNQELFFWRGPVCHTLVCFYILDRGNSIALCYTMSREKETI
jgi:hypothetical protein